MSDEVELPKTPFRLEPFGEDAVIVLLEGGIDETNYRRLSSLAESIHASPPPGFVELVPAYCSMLVIFDPIRAEPASIIDYLQMLSSSQDPSAVGTASHIVELPVAYGGEFGPDLDTLASQTGLSQAELISIHSSKPYLVYMLGFIPGFPYLGGMDQRIAAPRLKTPRTKVPAGSVGIADAQTGVYPFESPGGWNLIGRTPLVLFDPARVPPALLSPGDFIRFIPIQPTEFQAAREKALQASDSSRKAILSGAPASAAIPPAIIILKPGALSMVQDAGRQGYQAAGVPPSGPMDDYSMNLANILAGNEPGAACIECTLGGLELRFEVQAVVALAGAATPVFLDDQAVPLHRTIRAKAGQILRLGMSQAGLRVYVAVGGGLAVPRIMGSRATFIRGGFGGLDGRALAQGDRLQLGSPRGEGKGGPSDFIPRGTAPDRAIPQEYLPGFHSDISIRVIPSHEAECFSHEGKTRFYSEAYTVSQKSDRMGCRLEGPGIEHCAGADIISSGVQTGTVQVPGDGQPIVLMTDRQTTGGYTRIAHVIRADLHLLGQARPGDRVRFVRCSLAEAAAAFAARTELLGRLPGESMIRASGPRDLDHGFTEPGIPDREPSTIHRTGAKRNFRVSIGDQIFNVSTEELP